VQEFITYSIAFGGRQTTFGFPFFKA